MNGFGNLGAVEGPFSDWEVHKMASSNAPGIDVSGAEVTVIGEPGVDGAYIASTHTEADIGVEIEG